MKDRGNRVTCIEDRECREQAKDDGGKKIRKDRLRETRARVIE